MMDAAGVASAHVFGASMGGMIAQELALNHPVARALADPRLHRLRRHAGRCRRRRRSASRSPRAATMTREEAMWAMAPYIFDAGTPRERVAEDIAVRLARHGHQRRLLRAAGGDPRVEPAPTIGSAGLAMPTLVIHGETDQLVPAENGRIIAKAIPHARLVMIPNASHIFFTDQFEASSRALLSFLEGATPPEVRCAPSDGGSHAEEQMVRARRDRRSSSSPACRPAACCSRASRTRRPRSTSTNCAPTRRPTASWASCTRASAITRSASSTSTA